ncbi:MAG TPA: 1-acyl-sn-glycerol-3-phosphate acyltransferase [Patescibacteria group bacterium]|nr:1-acyl-sn-glycerol-3-phosphate acyltransferase [Patescibacteria group bacterium]
MSEYSREITSLEKVHSPIIKDVPPPTEKLGVLAGQLEDLEHMPDKNVMAPVHVALSIAMRGTKTYFEKGTREEIAEHRDAGGSFLLLMTHFRRWEIPAIGQITHSNASLRHLRFRTGITSRREIGELPGVGYIVRNSGCQFIDRSYENTGETEQEKKARQDRNQAVQASGANFITHGGHWLMFPEGGSKEILMEDGKKVIGPDGKAVRVPRQPDKPLPLQMGFVNLLGCMTPEQRARVKIMGIAAHYGKRRASSWRPTIVIPRLVTPLEGNYESKDHQSKVLQQGQDLFKQAVADAVALDALRD